MVTRAAAGALIAGGEEGPNPPPPGPCRPPCGSYFTNAAFSVVFGTVEDNTIC